MKAHPRLEEHTNFMVDHQAEKSSWWVLCELSDAVLEDVLIDGSGLAKFHLHINALEGNHSLNDCPFEAHRSEVSFPRARAGLTVLVASRLVANLRRTAQQKRKKKKHVCRECIRECMHVCRRTKDNPNSGGEVKGKGRGYEEKQLNSHSHSHSPQNLTETEGTF